MGYAWANVILDADDDRPSIDGIDEGDTQILACEYDPLHRRIVKTDEDADVDYDYYYCPHPGFRVPVLRRPHSRGHAPGILVQYSEWRVLEVRRDADTDPFEQYVWGLRYVHSPVVRWRDGNASTAPDGTVDDTLYYCTDANFNVTALVNTSGSVVERYIYSPYGERTIYNADWSSTVTWANSYQNVVGFTGHKLDPETGLVYGNRRYYHPTLGRWVTPDPTDYADGLNRSLVLASNPVRWGDPLGLYVGPSAVGDVEDFVVQTAHGLSELGGGQHRPEDVLRGLLLNWVGDIPSWQLLGALGTKVFDPGGNDEGKKNLFIYTCRCGWIDLGHFFTSAAASRYLIDERGLSPTAATLLSYGASLAVELHQLSAALWGDQAWHQAMNQGLGQAINSLTGQQTFGWPTPPDEGWALSAFTYEDLPSNWQGARFGASLGNNGNMFVSMLQYLRRCGAVSTHSSDRLANGKTAKQTLVDDAQSLKDAVIRRPSTPGRIPWNLLDPYAILPFPKRTPSHDCVCDRNGDPIPRARPGGRTGGLFWGLTEDGERFMERLR